MAEPYDTEQETPEFAGIAELSENLVYRLPGCADLMIRKTIQEVCREFCGETQCLTFTAPIPLVPGEFEYVVSPAYGGIVAGIRSVHALRRRLVRGAEYRIRRGTTSLTLELSPRIVPPPPPMDERGGFMSVSGSPLAENPAPPPRILAVEAYEEPKLNSEKLPRWFVQRFGDAICSGVLSRLCAMTGRAWTDTSLASAELVRYENAKSETRMLAELPNGGRFIDTSMVL